MAMVAWLSWLEGGTMYQKVVGSIPLKAHPGCGLNP